MLAVFDSRVGAILRRELAEFWLMLAFMWGVIRTIGNKALLF